MDYYIQLTIHQRIWFKENYQLWAGATWDQLRILFSMRELIDLGISKLRMENII